MTVLPGSLRTVLGPMRCRECGRLVIFGVATHILPDSWDSRVLRRGLFDKATEQVHRCQGRQAKAA